MSRRSELVLEILRERGPLRAEEVGLELAARGGTRAKDPVASAREALRWDSGVVDLRDGRWMALVWALDGVVLPHRVVPQERDRSCLRLDPDLTVLAPLVLSGALRSPAGPLFIVLHGIHDPGLDPAKAVPDRFLVLPYGVARRLVPGSMIGVAVRGGILDIVALDDAVPASAETMKLLESVAAELPGLPPSSATQMAAAVDDLLLEAAAVAPALLRTLTEPIGDTLRRCGLITRRDLLGTPHSDWEWLDRGAAVWHLVSRWEWQDGDPNADPDPTDWSWSQDLRTAMGVD